VPAAAVIPAPIAYIKAVAVKKLVVGSRGEVGRSAVTLGVSPTPPAPAFRSPPSVVDSAEVESGDPDLLL